MGGDRSPDASRQAKAGVYRRAAIVIGLDGSESSWNAFWWACGQAKLLGKRMVAVYVSRGVEPTTAVASGMGIYDDGAMESLAAEWAEQLELRVGRHAAEDEVDLEFLHLRGDAVNEILRVAERVAADLIVVGRSTKAFHQLAGSSGRRLVVKKQAPVVVVVP
ncbi:MAG TPA: universal stress protein [Solirubrobacterales bacterium]|jgi:nucleotide-binding universal stress UspA family protein|nr:universal stress protein [Solirubrobacterales bacterium]